MNVVLTKVASSNVESFGYDRDYHMLIVKFKGSPQFYLYHGVPAEIAAEMERAVSTGKYLSEHIKGKYNFSSLQLEPIVTPIKEAPIKAESFVSADVILSTQEQLPGFPSGNGLNG